MTDKANMEEITEITASMTYRSGYSGELIKTIIALVEADFKIKIDLHCTDGSMTGKNYKKILESVREIDETSIVGKNQSEMHINKKNL